MFFILSLPSFSHALFLSSFLPSPFFTPTVSLFPSEMWLALRTGSMLTANVREEFYLLRYDDVQPDENNRNFVAKFIFRSSTVSQARSQNEADRKYIPACCLPHAGFFEACFLLDLLLHPEDGGDIFLRNVWLSPAYMSWYPGRQNSSQLPLW
jgi:hypothetical protein